MDCELKRKIIIKADMKVQTGLHIGGSDAYSAIGAVDAPVIRSLLNNTPIVPGSSLKGKLRSLLAAVKDSKEEYRNIKTDQYIIKRLFGSSESRVVSESRGVSRLQFADAYIKDFDKENPRSLTEVKFENTIDRATGKSNNLRQIERVVPGTVFAIVIVYNELNEQETEEDLRALAEGMKLLQYDYLGGHGTRGYGRVNFKNIDIEIVNGKDSDKETLKGYFEKVEKSELLSI